ncbi:hypothetical protein [Rubinisphaera italica]|uniref:Uncharacterized protein n=1 Tax=Rubinisphaera italica TaxID=2527969 RepID=A0A5C5XL17_9PLAN|nr:hypothetical protein [Rubinisphaera italica]TWT63239.1 hypothetical protein Pan54_39920 [Rubinisphaera italica]
MTEPQKKSALVSAIFVGVLSLGLPWMTMESGNTFRGIGFPFAGGTVDVSAFSGSSTFLVKIPFWFLVFLSIAASVIQLLRNNPSFAFPQFIKWGMAIFPVVWISSTMLLVIFSAQATLGIGLILGLASALIPLICLFLPAGISDKSDPHNDANGA